MSRILIDDQRKERFNMSNTLDITDFKQDNYEYLRTAIVQAVKDTQSVIIRELPNEILMTKKQFKILQLDPDLQQLYKSKDFLYHTPYNVMELRIK